MFCDAALLPPMVNSQTVPYCTETRPHVLQSYNLIRRLNDAGVLPVTWGRRNNTLNRKLVAKTVLNDSSVQWRGLYIPGLQMTV